MTGRDRQRLYRWRRRNGRLPLRIDVDDVSWPEKLIALGRLRRGQEDDRDAIREATIALIDELCVADLRNRQA